MTKTLQERGYAPKVARRHTKWVRKFQAFTRSKAPDVLSSEDARAFLAWLPTKRKMSFSKQTQVFEALLFFYKHVLKKELGVERPIRAQAITTNPRAAMQQKPTPGPSQEGNSTAVSPSRKQSTPGAGKGASWEMEFTKLKNAIQMRQYSNFSPHQRCVQVVDILTQN